MVANSILVNRAKQSSREKVSPTSMAHLAKGMKDLNEKLEQRKNFKLILSSLLKIALNGYLAGVVTHKELDLVLSISSLRSVLDIPYTLSTVTPVKKCPNTSPTTS